MEKLQQYTKQLEQIFSNKEVAEILTTQTFKDLPITMVRSALLEGFMKGYTLDDFVTKKIYAVRSGKGYVLITSIDNARLVGSENGVVGTDAPIYTYKEDGSIYSCTVTVKKKTDDYIGDYSSTVFWDEYYAGHKNADGTIKSGKFGELKPNSWDKLGGTMIAKVAEMHSLRKACPIEKLTGLYDYSEMQRSLETPEAPQTKKEDIEVIEA